MPDINTAADLRITPTSLFRKFCLNFSTAEGSIDAHLFLQSVAETDTEFSKNKACPVVADTDNKLVSDNVSVTDAMCLIRCRLSSVVC